MSRRRHEDDALPVPRPWAYVNPDTAEYWFWDKTGQCWRGPIVNIKGWQPALDYSEPE